jgi:hypothetical protein
MYDYDNIIIKDVMNLVYAWKNRRKDEFLEFLIKDFIICYYVIDECVDG